MNYNKMLKKDLIDVIKIIRAENAEIKAKCNDADRKLNMAFKQLESVRAVSAMQCKDMGKLEKANAEQAKTIRGLETELDDLRSVYNNCSMAANEGARLVADLKEENTRIKRLAAQMLCADVLEGK